MKTVENPKNRRRVVDDGALGCGPAQERLVL